MARPGFFFSEFADQFMQTQKRLGGVRPFSFDYRLVSAVQIRGQNL